MESLPNDALFTVNVEALVENDLADIISADALPINQIFDLPAPSEETIEESEQPDIDHFIDELINSNSLSYEQLVAPPTASAEPEGPPCTHDTCALTDYTSIWQSFAEMDISQRVAVVRNMLFATTAPKGEKNQLTTVGADHKAIARGMKRRQGQTEIPCRTTVVYSVRGSRLCRDAFSHLVSLDTKTVERHASKVANGEGLVLDISRKAQSRKGIFGVQRIVIAGFLYWYGSTNGLECPCGRGSKHNKPRILLPSTTSKVDVHDDYKASWPTLIEAAMALSSTNNKASGPLSYVLFCRYRGQDFPTLRIATSGSDFCDLCTTLKDDLKNLDANDERHRLALSLLTSHRRDAKQEFLFYKKCQNVVASNPHGESRHFVFDFAEKVLLPKLHKQPGQLHFITGLKFDLFGIASSNENLNYLFGLPEGHWPNDKTANVVCSMLHHLLDAHKKEGRPGARAKHLQLHADNCAGQNKNRYMLWYCCWRVIMGLDDEIDHYFLVAGHTKNVCDGAFGHVKRLLKTTDVRTTHDMMKVIRNSSSTTRCIPSVDVSWFLWKEYLSTLFRMPAKFQMSKFHCFSMKCYAHGTVNSRALTSDKEPVSFNLLQRSITADMVRESWVPATSNVYFQAKIPGLDFVPSAQHVTRKNYLSVNILQRYYAHDALLKDAFFLEMEPKVPYLETDLTNAQSDRAELKHAF